MAVRRFLPLRAAGTREIRNWFRASSTSRRELNPIDGVVEVRDGYTAPGGLIVAGIDTLC